MSHYFRFVGVIEILGWLAGIVLLIVSYVIQRIETLYFVIALISLIFLGPAFGLLFFMVADLMDKYDEDGKLKSKYFEKTSDGIIVGGQVLCIDQELREKHKIPSQTVGKVTAIEGDEYLVNFKFGEQNKTIRMNKNVVKKA